MSGQSDINEAIFDRIEKIEGNVESMSATLAEMRGMVSTSMKATDKMISLLGKTVWALVILLFFFAGAVIYGAIGEKGLKSVRDALPSTPSLPLKPDYPLPNPPDGLDKWTNSFPSKV